jgi:hypothetical protein
MGRTAAKSDEWLFGNRVLRVRKISVCLPNVDNIADGDISKRVIGLPERVCGKTTTDSNRTWAGLMIMPLSAIYSMSGVIADDGVAGK